MNAPARPIIFAEFNELCPWLIDQWIDEGILPNFARLRAQSSAFETKADVEHAGQLEPWIQWYSLHTGLAFEQHGVFHLTDGAKASHDDLWHVLNANGRKVGSFASMNTRAFAFPGSFYVADPWSDDGNANPAELDIYGRFVAQNVREYSNPDAVLGLGDYANFLSFMLRRGMSAKTIAKIIRQLAHEKLVDGKDCWKRAALLDRLQFDVFRHYQRRHRPDFSTFFINSTAHLQHSYWRAFEPDKFTVKPSEEDQKRYGDAIRFGYQAMDDLLGDFMALADECGAMLVFMTALSQQPFLRAEQTGGKHFYRMRDVEAFFRQFGLPFANIDPTMTHQFLARFACREDKAKVDAAVEAFTFPDGSRVFDKNNRESDGIYFGCGLATSAPDDLTFTDPSGQSHAFGTHFYRIDATKSGCHHPSGALWFANGKPNRVAKPVSILDIFPTTLEMQGIDPSLFEDRRGKSLLPML
jgi:Type I phosphodiesterase / nucleotide pyrophosphatase